MPGAEPQGLRILFVCDWFLKVVVQQALALRAAGARPAILCREHAHEFAGSQAERRRLLGAACSAGIPVFTVEGRIRSPRAVRSLLRARRAISRWRPALVHVHDNGDPRLLWLAYRHPRVLTIHDPIDHPGAPAASLLCRAARAAWWHGAARIIVHGNELVGELPSGSMRARAVAVPLTPPAAVSDKAVVIPKLPTILFFGRMERYKGIPTLLAAMERVWRDRPDLRLLMAGDGPERPVSALRPGVVEVRGGYIPEVELDALFAEATVTVLPYDQASQSAVGLLSIARGIPVVVTDVGALGGLATDEAHVAPPGDPVRLAQAILAAIDHDMKIRERTLEMARAAFGPQATARALLAVYASLGVSP